MSDEAERRAKRVSGNAIVSIALECGRYADAYRALYGEDLARDGTLAHAWLVILQALVVLLRGELGTHDVAHIHALIRSVGVAAGYPSCAVDTFNAIF